MHRHSFLLIIAMAATNAKMRRITLYTIAFFIFAVMAVVAVVLIIAFIAVMPGGLSASLDLLIIIKIT